MQAPNWTDFLQCSVCTNRYNTTTLAPISLSCGHTICKKCLAEFMTRVCPYDKTAISPNAELLPPNSALMWLLGAEEGEAEDQYFSQLCFSAEDLKHFKAARTSIKSTAVFLQSLSDQGGSTVIHYLTRPMLKKLVTVVNCQFLEADGRARVLRAARSITDRTITELLVMHQNQQQISTLLWSAIRSRGCQFLGPVMQEEALKLILKVLEGGAFLSRKNIVLYVVQQLQQHDFHQASKTCVGHVVQLLYRASCFNVEKRDDDSSRMRLKEEFRTYEALRREHDAQIIRVAMEGGLRISPEQWSALLYGDQKHKSDMQSIIDKLLSQGIATSGLSELIVAIRRSQDQHNLLEKIVPHLEKLLKVDINIDKASPLVEQWSFFAETMAALVSMLHEFSSFMRIQSGRYKTGLCPNLTKPGGCPKGDKCTYAHTEEERERYRHLARGAKNKSRELGKPVSGPQSIPGRPGSGRWSGDMGTKLDSSPYSSLGTSFERIGPGFPSGGQTYSSGGSGFGVTTNGYSEYSSLPTAAAVASTTPIVLQPVVRQPTNLTSDPTLPSHVISAQPQLVAYRSPHHSGPITVSGEHLAVYDSHIDHTYFTAPTRSNSIPDDYGVSTAVMGVASDGTQYPANAHHNSFMTAPLPSTLDSIKQVHADIKRNITPALYDSSNTQYPADTNYLHNEGAQYDNYPQTGGTHTYTPEAMPAPDQRHYHHDNEATIVPADHVTSSGAVVYPTDSERGPVMSREGEEREGEGDDPSDQMSQLQLKDPGYYETAGYSTTSSAGYTSSESYSQYSVSHSDKYPTTTAPDHGIETASLQQPPYSAGVEKVSSSSGTTSGEGVGGGANSGPSGGGGGGGATKGDNVEAMKEKIRLLEAQLAREKMKSTQSGQQQSPAHSGLVYGNTTDGYPVQPVPRYTTPVQMYPTVSVQQPAFYTTDPATPTYQHTCISGELASLQTVPHGSAGYVLQQRPQPAVGRSVYVQQQPVAPLQDVKDHMLAMYLQTLEQSRVPQLPYTQHHPLPSPYTPSHQHSSQAGYGGGASLGYPPPNHYVPPSGTQYVMKPY